MTRAELFQFMNKRRLGVLGSISPEGEPQSALVGIAVTPELEIVFDTVKSTRKYRNLTANPRASFAIGWEGEATIQYEGTVFEPEGDELLRYREIYFVPYPDGRDRLKWTGITHFVVRPKWIRFSDYAQNPPRIEEITFG
jgi:hypothetical protein